MCAAQVSEIRMFGLSDSEKLVALTVYRVANISVERVPRFETTISSPVRFLDLLRDEETPTFVHIRTSDQYHDAQDSRMRYDGMLKEIPTEYQPASWSWEQRPGQNFLRELGRPDAYTKTPGFLTHIRLGLSNRYGPAVMQRVLSFSPGCNQLHSTALESRWIVADGSSYANLVSSWACLVPLCRPNPGSWRYSDWFPDCVNWLWDCSVLKQPWNFFDSIRWIYRSMPPVWTSVRSSFHDLTMPTSGRMIISPCWLIGERDTVINYPRHNYIHSQIIRR